MCWKALTKKIRKCDWIDISLVKLSVAAFVLFIVSFLSAKVLEKITSWRWLWFLLFIIFAIKPFYVVWIKNNPKEIRKIKKGK